MGKKTEWKTCIGVSLELGLRAKRLKEEYDIPYKDMFKKGVEYAERYVKKVESEQR